VNRTDRTTNSPKHRRLEDLLPLPQQLPNLVEVMRQSRAVVDKIYAERYHPPHRRSRGLESVRQLDRVQKREESP
jgi:hypothetical protein